MPRAIAVFVAASTLFACALASGAAAGRSGPSTARVPNGARSATDEGTILLRARYRRGLWKKSLRLRLVKTRLTTFELCAIRNYVAGTKYDCNLERGARLTNGETLRLEQNPVGKALVRDDSPGWGMLGISLTARLGAIMSNTVTGNNYGTYRYRVTLRDGSGQVLATSNSLPVDWHR